MYQLQEIYEKLIKKNWWANKNVQAVFQKLIHNNQERQELFSSLIFSNSLDNALLVIDNHSKKLYVFDNFVLKVNMNLRYTVKNVIVASSKFAQLLGESDEISLFHLMPGFIVWTKKINTEDKFEKLLVYKEISQKNDSIKNEPINFLAVTEDGHLKVFVVFLIKLEIKIINLGKSGKFYENFLSYTIVNNNNQILLTKNGFLEKYKLSNNSERMLGSFCLEWLQENETSDAKIFGISNQNIIFVIQNQSLKSYNINGCDFVQINEFEQFSTLKTNVKDDVEILFLENSHIVLKSTCYFNIMAFISYNNHKNEINYDEYSFGMSNASDIIQFYDGKGISVTYQDYSDELLVMSNRNATQNVVMQKQYKKLLENQKNAAKPVIQKEQCFIQKENCNSINNNNSITQYIMEYMNFHVAENKIQENKILERIKQFFIMDSIIPRTFYEYETDICKKWTDFEISMKNLVEIFGSINLENGFKKCLMYANEDYDSLLELFINSQEKSNFLSNFQEDTCTSAIKLPLSHDSVHFLLKNSTWKSEAKKEFLIKICQEVVFENIASLVKVCEYTEDDFINNILEVQDDFFQNKNESQKLRLNLGQMIFYRNARKLTADQFKLIKLEEYVNSKDKLVQGNLKGSQYDMEKDCTFCKKTLNKKDDLLALLDESYKIVGLSNNRLAHMRCFKRSYSQRTDSRLKSYIDKHNNT